MGAMKALLMDVCDDLNVDPYDDDGELDPRVAAEVERRLGVATEPTPGPWAVHGEWITRADETAESTKNEYGYQSGHYVAHVAEPIGGRAVCDANARLIAAAPELASLCERLILWIRDPIIAEAVGDECGVWPVVDEAAKVLCRVEGN